MPHDPKQQKQIMDLLIPSLEGEASHEDLQKLKEILDSSSEARDYYLKAVMIAEFIRKLDWEAEDVEEEVGSYKDLNKQMWEALSVEEKTAQAVEIPKDELEKKDELSDGIHKVRPKVSKFSIYSLLLSSAALIFVIVYAHFISMRHGIEVATLTDSMNAKWADAAAPMAKGTRMATGNEQFLLREGYAELLFDNQTRITFEGPAEFQILAEDRIGLTYGKVYATVPKKAIGFSVYTPIAKIIDMGTEFGVEADSRGDTRLHVLEGKTALLVGQNDYTINVEVGMGQARNVSGSTQIVTEIPLHENYFVRSFDSANNIVWRHQMSLDLADIVRNGNGLGTGNSEVRLNHEKGFTNEKRWGHTSTFKAYLPIQDHPFIDGIFIPNGKTVVSSQGHVFEDFLMTDGVYCADLFASPDPGLFIIDGQPRTIQFDGQEYSDRGKSCIVMQNSNHGITFDLDAIRNHYNLKIDRFTSRVGLIDFDKKRCNANFYVLVDGQLRYSLLGYTPKGVLNDVSVKLEDTDRFLTLATSENVDQIDFMANSTLYENWCVFTEPVLMLE